MIIEIENWAKDAACRGRNVEDFFDSDDFVDGKMTAGQRQMMDSERRLRAKLICSTCQVREECLRHGLSDDSDTFSILGGYTAYERAQVRRGIPLPEFGYSLVPGSAPPLSRGWSLVRRFAAGETLRDLCLAYNIKRQTAMQELRYALASGEWMLETDAA